MTAKVDPKEQTKICVVLNGEELHLQLNTFARRCKVPVRKVVEAYHEDKLTAKELVIKFHDTVSKETKALNAFLYKK